MPSQAACDGQTQVQENTMLRTFVIGAVSALTLTAAAADETLKFSSILHATFVESQDVGDVDGHAMSLTRYSGLTRISDGTTGLCYFVATTDYIEGADAPFREAMAIKRERWRAKRAAIERAKQERLKRPDPPRRTTGRELSAQE